MAYPLLPAVPHVAPLAAPSVVSFGAPSDAPVELLCDTPSRAEAPVTATDVPLTYNDVRPGQRTSIAVACIALPGPADKKLGSTLGVEAYNLLTRNEKTKPWVQPLKATYIVVVQVVCPERPLPDVKGTQTFASVFPQLGCPQKCIANATEDTAKCAFTDEEMRDLVGLSQRARRAVYTARDNAKWAPEEGRSNIGILLATMALVYSAWEDSRESDDWLQDGLFDAGKGLLGWGGDRPWLRHLPIRCDHLLYVVDGDPQARPDVFKETMQGEAG